MNTVLIASEVLSFVAAVRGELADLDLEEQREILDGLEADLNELVADRGAEALGDPVAYAAELRQAAGLATPAKQDDPRIAVGVRVHALLDAVKGRVDTVLAALPGDVGGLMHSLPAVWWVLRAYIAVQSTLLWSGGWALSVVPDDSTVGALVLLLAVLGSVQLGRRRLWPVTRWSGNAALRLVVIGLNVLAVVMVPAVMSGLDHRGSQFYEEGIFEGVRIALPDGDGDDRAGMYVDGRWVSNIYPYDAQGQPLVGVQLFDQTGKPVDVVTATECVYDAAGQQIDAGRTYYPWSDGAVQKRNVFPVPSKVAAGDTLDPDPLAFAGKDKPTVSGFPFASVPKISLPGLLASIGKTPPQAFVPGPRTGPINPIDNGC